MSDTLVLILSVVVGVLGGIAITWGIRISTSRRNHTDALTRQVDAIAHHLEQEAE